MRRFAGSCRYVYNKALVLQKERHEKGGKKLGYAGLCRLLTEWRHSEETAWLAKEASGEWRVASGKEANGEWRMVQNPLFAIPYSLLTTRYWLLATRYRKKGRSDSFRYPDPKGIKLDQANSRIFLPKLGWLRYRNSREVLGTVKNVTVSQSCGKWFVSIQTEREVETSRPKRGTVGIDLGIAHFATLSDGTFFAPLNSFKRHEVALRKAQQSLSRKVKGSHNRKKALARVQKIHVRIANVRRDFLHKVSTAISKNHAVVAIEDLKVGNMSRSAAGTADAPGKNVHTKSGLNKSILDQGWYGFRRMLEYKLSWKGGRLVAVPPQNTSRTCPGCGHVSADNRQTQARFVCVACGYENNADVVGAINILSRGIQLLRDEGQDTANALVGMQVDWLPVSARMACGSNCIGSRKQEPAETTARGAIRA